MNWKPCVMSHKTPLLQCVNQWWLLGDLLTDTMGNSKISTKIIILMKFSIITSCRQKWNRKRCVLLLSCQGKEKSAYNTEKKDKLRSPKILIFTVWLWHHMVWDIPMVSYPGCIPSKFLRHPQTTWWQCSMRSRKILDLV